jgi:polyisoprenoid-binding protein YceI
MHSRHVLLLALLVMFHGAMFAAERPIDLERSQITVHVGKAGLFSMAGHEHQVRAPLAEGALDDSATPKIRFIVESAKLTVLPEKDQAQVQADMQKKVLDSERFPEIRFESTGIRKTGQHTWKVTGNLTLHGRTRPVTAEVDLREGAYRGNTTLKQTDYGIQPIAVAGGTVKVKDELKIEFSIVPR